MQMDSSDLSAIKARGAIQGRKITADYVADALREAIQSGRLPDGAVLNQAAIAEHLGVSRVPVREAMRQLMAEGLIQSKAHHVAVVSSLSLEGIAQVYEYRALLEGHLTEKNVPLITEQAIETMKAKNEEMRTIRSHTRWLRLNRDFHDLILTAGEDEIGLELIEQLRVRSERYVRMWSGGRGIHDPEGVEPEHAEMIRAIEARDASAARAAVERHIRHTGERIVAYGTSLTGAAANSAS